MKMFNKTVPFIWRCNRRWRLGQLDPLLKDSNEKEPVEKYDEITLPQVAIVNPTRWPLLGPCKNGKAYTRYSLSRTIYSSRG
jgi:hypothetical protein